MIPADKYEETAREAVEFFDALFGHDEEPAS